MPFYEYECPSCRYYLEVLQKISDRPLKKCPSCGKAGFRRLMSAPVFRLKGSGWYETDFKSDKESQRNLAVAEDKPEGAEAKPAAPEAGKAADAKPAAKPDAAAATAEKPPARPRKSSAPARSARGTGVARPAAKRTPRVARPASRRKGRR